MRSEHQRVKAPSQKFMTAINVIRQANAVHVLTDGIVCNSEGIITGSRAKCLYASKPASSARHTRADSIHALSGPSP